MNSAANIQSLVAQLMKKRGLTVRTIADMTGLSTRTIQNARIDISSCQLRTLTKIADALGVKVEELFEQVE